MLDEGLRWTVHVVFIDGVADDAIGRPTVVDGCLRVAVEDDEGVDFEVMYPLSHVRMWWCDYTGGDKARKNARGRRWPVGGADGPRADTEG